MSCSISRIAFLRRRGGSVLASKRHVFSSMHTLRGTNIISNGSLGTYCSSKGHAHDHVLRLISKHINHGGSAYFPLISGIAFHSRSSSSISGQTLDIDIKIISKEEIKPASPTPDHLKFYTLSIFDQLNPHMYATPTVYFYPNTQISNKQIMSDIILERRQRLKKSLSETLERFYPLAGKIKDNMHIECNDAGGYYVEATANVHLQHFLQQPADNKSINLLLPVHPSSVELLSKTYPVMIQTNIFECGGIAIGVYASHKVVDAVSRLTFMKAWAATAKESSSSDQTYPSFVSSSIFLPHPSLSKDSSFGEKTQSMEVHYYVTKRFMFEHSNLAELKIKAANSSFTNPSSVAAVMGLLWKSFIALLNAQCDGVQKQSILPIPVNLRTRSSPPLPPHSFGNIWWIAFAKYLGNPDPELQLLVNEIKNSIATINPDFVEGIKGENRIEKLMEPLKDVRELFSKNNAELLAISSICKNNLYDVDFGWGKPIWTCISRGSRDVYGKGNRAILMDTRSGDGIEAWVTMKEEDMVIFEKNPDLLAFASLDPSPLQT